jgi:hypothetical protein
VKRELLIAGAVATIVAGVAGCSSDNKASGPSPSSATASRSVTASSSTAAAAGPAQVTVGGQPQNVSGPVVCATTDGKFSIAVGDMVTGIIVGVEPDASAVHNAVPTALSPLDVGGYVPAGTTISVYTTSGALLYTTTVGSQQTTVVSSRLGGDFNTGVTPFLQDPIYLSYGPSGSGTTIFDT